MLFILTLCFLEFVVSIKLKDGLPTERAMRSEEFFEPFISHDIFQSSWELLKPIDSKVISKPDFISNQPLFSTDHTLVEVPNHFKVKDFKIVGKLVYAIMTDKTTSQDYLFCILPQNNYIMHRFNKVDLLLLKIEVINGVIYVLGNDRSILLFLQHSDLSTPIAKLDFSYFSTIFDFIVYKGFLYVSGINSQESKVTISIVDVFVPSTAEQNILTESQFFCINPNDGLLFCQLEAHNDMLYTFSPLGILVYDITDPHNTLGEKLHVDLYNQNQNEKGQAFTISEDYMIVMTHLAVHIYELYTAGETRLVKIHKSFFFADKNIPNFGFESMFYQITLIPGNFLFITTEQATYSLDITSDNSFPFEINLQHVSINHGCTRIQIGEKMLYTAVDNLIFKNYKFGNLLLGEKIGGSYPVTIRGYDDISFIDYTFDFVPHCNITCAHGESTDIECTKCICGEGYFGITCGDWDCFNFNHNNSDVCSKKGKCYAPNSCNCTDTDLYSGENCHKWSCFGINNTNTTAVCSGFGTCSDFDTCSCKNELYSGQDCSLFKCFGIENSNLEVCSGNGECLDIDHCKCSISNPHGDPLTDCSGFRCNEGYYGENCDIFACGEYLSNETNVCSGDGTCLTPGICKCKTKIGDFCEIDCPEGSILIGSTCQTQGFVIGTSLGIGFGIFGLILFIGLNLFVVFSCWYFIVKFRKKANRFDHIDGVDLILKEAELEQQTKGPKLELKKSSYLIEYKDITLKSLIGEGGSQSKVFHANWNGVDCAFKSFNIHSFSQISGDQSYESFEKEIGICVALNHPSILQFYGAVISPTKIGIVCEYCAYGDLSSFFLKYKKKENKDFSISRRIKLLNDIILGMEYLHLKNYVHRDLKPENVLMDDKESPKITDFGLSKLTENSEKTMTKGIGTNYYMAPEVFNGENYTNKCDVYSWALVSLFVLSENCNPYGEVSVKYSDYKYVSKAAKDPKFRPKINEEYFDECKWLIPLIKRSWDSNPEQRNTFSELKEIFKKHNEETKPQT